MTARELRAVIIFNADALGHKLPRIQGGDSAPMLLLPSGQAEVSIHGE